MSRFISLLEGPYAREWEDVLPGPHASHRATTSSRTPGRVNRGVVYRRDFEHGELRICKCGQQQKQCADCGAFVCRATGHAPHVCGSAW